jgi:N-acetylmuramoyl-L-alanine amidase
VRKEASLSDSSAYPTSPTPAREKSLFKAAESTETRSKEASCQSARQPIKLFPSLKNLALATFVTTLRALMLRRAIFLVIALVWCAVTANAMDWTLIKVGGRDHVTMDNVAEFYGLGKVRRVGNDFIMSAGQRSLRGAEGSVEFFINGLKFNLSYPIAESGSQLLVSRMDLTKVIEPVLRPQRIQGAESVDTVVLDAGHGGHDNGAYSQWGWEKDFTLDVVIRARTLLQQAGYKVAMTRSSDTFVPLYDRVRYANQFKNAVFISIHFNSGGAAATGLETYTLAPRGVPSMMADGPRISDLDPCAGQINDAENMALATATHAAMVVRSRMFDRGIKRARFVVIRDIVIPGVLVEGGFLSNVYDARLISTPAYRQQMASCVLQAVQNYRRAVGPQSSAQMTARSYAEPRVEFSTRRDGIDSGSAAINGGSQFSTQPTVITPTAPAQN